jgi:hypothetical protein
MPLRILPVFEVLAAVRSDNHFISATICFSGLKNPGSLEVSPPLLTPLRSGISAVTM